MNMLIRPSAISRGIVFYFGKKEGAKLFFYLMTGAASERLGKFFKEKKGQKRVGAKCEGWALRPSKIMRAEKNFTCNVHGKIGNFNKSLKESDLRIKKDAELRQANF